MKLFTAKRDRLNVGQADAAATMRAAVSQARQRLGGEGQLIGLAAGLVLLAFILLALAAPLALAGPGFVSWIAGGLVLLVLLAGAVSGIVAVTRMARAGNLDATRVAAPDLNSAIATVMGEAEDAGLKTFGPREADEAFSGRIAGRPCAVVRHGGRTWAVARAPATFGFALALTPAGVAWPHPLPDDGQLTPCQPPEGLDALAWATDRLKGGALLEVLAPALRLAAAGGELPLLSVRNRSVVMAFTRADAASALVVACEAARALAVAPEGKAG